MNDTFHLPDLYSQARAVRQHLAGRSSGEILAWLAARGELKRVPTATGEATYRFVSSVGIECVFFLRDDLFVFLGDTTYTAPEVRTHE